jgi:hypothetical protein
LKEAEKIKNEESPLLDKIIEAIFSQQASFQEHESIFSEIGIIPSKDSFFWQECEKQYAAFSLSMAPIALLPVMKTREWCGLSENQFSPISQDNPPLVLDSLQIGDKKCDLLHLPSVTKQEILEEAEIEEIALHYFKNEIDPILLINLQDRTSFKEIGRALAIDSLSDRFKNIYVISLPCKTDFYYQNPPYMDVADISSFFHLIEDQIKNEGTGFAFTKGLKEPILKKIKPIFDLLSKEFFEGRDLLSHQTRQDFITLFYTLLTVEVMHHIKPSKIAFVTKDGVDLSSTFSVLLQAVLSGGQISEEKRKEWCNLLFMPSLLVRGRAPHQEEMHRFIRAMRRLEEKK